MTLMIYTLISISLYIEMSLFYCYLNLNTKFLVHFHYIKFVDNAIPIKSWFCDQSDTALLGLLPVLDALRFTHDVRSVLSRKLHLHRLW